MSNLDQAGRRGFVGASEVASLFSLDLHEAGEKVYSTRFELWAQKSGLLESGFKGNERTRWGQRLEAGIAAGCAEEYGWTVRNARRYVLHPGVDRMGCSPDYEIISHPLGPAWLELKNVDRMIYNGWPLVEEADDEDFVAEAGLPYLHKRREPPLRLQLQLQHQLACSTRTWGVLALLVGGNELIPIPYPRVETTISRIEEEVPLFWAECDNETPPPVDWSADAGTIARLYGSADPRKILVRRGDFELLALAKEHHALGAEARELGGRREVLKAKILTRIEDACKVFLAEGYSISASEVAGREMSYFRDDYRDFRVNRKRG